MWRQDKYVARPDNDIIKLVVIENFENHIALELVKELLDRIVMKVRTLVRPADNKNHHVGVLPDLFVTYRGLQQMAVVIYPLLKVEC
jgi:hypothetical protein